MNKKLLIMITTALFVLCFCAGCGKEPTATLTVINYADYMDMSILSQFEKETGIRVIYEEAITPEELYTKYSSGAISYDLVCTSDYMVQRLISEGEAQKVDFSAMEHSKNIGQRFWDISKTFDTNNEYALPYFYGTVGILYDTTKVNGPIDSWDVLFNGEYKNQIIMQDSMRDSFMVTLKYLGHSLNTENKDEIAAAKDLMIKQKPDVSAYLVDEARDEVVAGNATMAVVYSGEAYLGHEYNNDLAYVVPKEGSNIWVDSWLVTKNCKNLDAAAKFMDFLCREDIATKNFEYIYYSTPNEAVVASMDDSLKNNPAIVPATEDTDRCEICIQPGKEITELYSEYWKEIKAN